MEHHMNHGSLFHTKEEINILPVHRFTKQKIQLNEITTSVQSKRANQAPNLVK
jgi:hypothetical protein